ncbi:MAG: hypothetical protein V1797_16580 [Pseudomonadota bacterium]
MSRPQALNDLLPPDPATPNDPADPTDPAGLAAAPACASGKG